MPKTPRLQRARAWMCLVAIVVASLTVLGTTGASASAPGDLWTPSAAKVLPVKAGLHRTVDPSSFRAYVLDATAMADRLSIAPLEDSRAARTGGTARVTIPAPTGEMIDFAVVESPVMESGLAAKYPDITTYAGNAVTPGYEGASIRLDTTRLGFHASVIGGGAPWYIDPAYIGDTDLYLSYFGAALPEPQRLPDVVLDPATGDTVSHEKAEAAARTPERRTGEGAGAAVIRREYRLALSTDPSYAAHFGASNPDNAVSDPLVLSAKVTLMNRVNQIYLADVAIKMLLVDGTDKLNFQTDAEFSGANGPCGATACYDAAEADGCSANSGSVIDTNLSVVGKLVGAENYDIGHIGYGPNGDGGGVAYLGAVGWDDIKAGGCTGLDPPTGDYYAIDFVAHEMGHQFAGNHTFNGANGSCAGNGEPTTSVEPGSGSSVMGYAGICFSDDLQPHTDPYFSQKSQAEITAHVTKATANFNEVQLFGLTAFDGTDSFKLDFAGTQTAVITRGGNFTTAGVKAAIEAAIGSGTATVASLSDTGFQVTYTGAKAATNIANPTFVVTSGTFTAVGGDTIKGGPSTNHGAEIATANHNPTVTAPAAKTIPVQTPFTLTGSAVDSDGDPLVYLWEQNNPANAPSLLVSQPKIEGPLFRIFGTYADVPLAQSVLYESPGENQATSDPSRTFPDLAQVVANQTNAATGACPPVDDPFALIDGLADGPVLSCYSEFLPTPAYLPTTMNFRLTARDQVATGGGTQFANVVLTIDKTLGPFLVSSPNTAVSYAGNSTQTVTWTSGMTSLAANVKISLSTDGGLTFPTVLLASTPNDGSQAVTIPNTATTQARIKVEAVENYFFDISNTNFTITGVAPTGLQVTQPGNPTQSVQYSDAIAPVAFAATTDRPAGVLAATVDAGTPLPAGVTLSARSGSDASANWTVSGTTTAAPGSYPVTINVTDGTETKTVPLTITVTKENASATYTGPTTASAPSGGDDAVELTLTADVAQAADGSLGDLTTATATFSDSNNADEVLCTSSVTAGGQASCAYLADLPADSGRTYAVKVTVGGRYVGQTEADSSLVVSIPGGLQVTPPPGTATAVYSDASSAVTFSATSDNPSASLSASPSNFPPGLSLTQSGTSTDASWQVSGAVTGAPGSYPATISVSDGVEEPQVLSITFTVTREDATATYTGQTSEELADAGDATADLDLAATIVASADGSTGDISTARATFTDTTTSTALCTDVVVAASATPGTGTANCSAALAPGSHTIQVTVGGRYQGQSSGTDVVVTVPATPQTTLTKVPGTWNLSETARFEFTSSVPGSTFVCTLDGVTKPCTSPYVATKLSHTTHTFSVKADNKGATDPTPASTRTTVPKGYRELRTETDGWKVSKNKNAYLGGFLRTNQKGQVLSYKVTDARKLAIVVGTGKNSGDIKVTFRGKTLRLIDLSGPRSRKKLVFLADFDAPTSGTLKIMTTTVAKRSFTRIEGLGVATSP